MDTAHASSPGPGSHRSEPFSILAKSREPLAAENLAAKTGAAPLLLGRILRYLSTMGYEEIAKDTFTVNNVTNNLSIPAIQAGIYHKYACPVLVQPICYSFRYIPTFCST
ncbi:hypothetical protein BDW68DRAFT_22705 [Aspergillus falconensis]